MQIRIEYRPEPVLTPITPWVHKGVDAAYYTATVFDPPRPKPILGKGYPLWVIEHRGRSLFFPSPEEIAHATMFFAAEASGWITGQTLSVAGGRIFR